MPKFTLICEHLDTFGEFNSGLKTTLEFNEDMLCDVVANIDTFLRGCGFIFDGCLTIEEPEPTSLREELRHSRYYFDTDRNR